MTSAIVTVNVETHVSFGSCLDTGDSTSYDDFGNLPVEYNPIKIKDKRRTGVFLHWVRIAITCL
ncbi:MAG: hypothetical protein LBL90_08995 [Prevotellaceae bacterium]|nr:hypothetical protein [Prevotellaceae bacterium]